MFEVQVATATTDNPAVAGAASQIPPVVVQPVRITMEAATFADLEAALAEPCGAEHAAQAVAVMERLMLAREDELAAKFEARLGGGASLDSVAAVRSVVAQLTEAPPNFHQATIYFAASEAPEDAPMAARARLLFLFSALMVLMQTVTAVGVCWGVVLPSCSSSEQCRERGATGTYCGDAAGNSRCDFCGRWVPLEIDFPPGTPDVDERRFVGGGTRRDNFPPAGGTMNWAEDAEFVGFNLTLVAEVCAAPTERRGTRGSGDNKAMYSAATVASWCETCVHAIDGTVDASTQTGRIAANISAMNRSDFIALAFATFIVACKVVGELKDIELCTLSVAHAGDGLGRGWRRAFTVLGDVRRRIFLPALVTTVPLLVMLKGGDALSVCFNTVAILFMCVPLQQG
eukprot:SAG22_NODE_9_length_35992_cov_37.278104_5_plen_401_part_00